MKPHAYFINVARGEIVDQAALVRALRERWFAGAGLDVFEHEPLPLDDPLVALDNVILTPHWLPSTTRRRAPHHDRDGEGHAARRARAACPTTSSIPTCSTDRAFGASSPAFAPTTPRHERPSGNRNDRRPRVPPQPAEGPAARRRALARHLAAERRADLRRNGGARRASTSSSSTRSMAPAACRRRST